MSDKPQQQDVTDITPEDYKYWAFVSYSHRDKEWAQWLHKSLETYKVPKKLVGRVTPQGSIPHRIFPVFRDRDELPGAADLGGKLKNALRRSRYLIVICSPNSAPSKWVNEEVKTYKALGREDRLLCLIVDGEPFASDKPGKEAEECFPPAVRYRVSADSELTGERAEPIAADARPGKDGRANSRLKLLAGILNVGYDELKQREKQRERMRRIRLAAGLVAVLMAALVIYVAIADAGLGVPGSKIVRTFLDRHEISLMRRAHSEAEIRRTAADLRRSLLETIRQRQREDGWIARSASADEYAIWAHAQAMSAVHRVSDAEVKTLGSFGKGLQPLMTQSYAADTKAPAVLWKIIALTNALTHPDLVTNDERRNVEAHLASTQEFLKAYHPLETGGWNIFSNQKTLSAHHTYTTALALLALLETRRAGLSWEGSIERRDALLKNTVGWFISHYDFSVNPPGWRGNGEESLTIYDGLTLQIYAELLRAEAEAGIVLPPQVLEQIPQHLESGSTRDLSYPVDGGEFSTTLIGQDGREYTGSEGVKYLWYPWAIACSAHWLQRAEKYGAPPEELIRVRRTLGHLVVNLGPEAAAKSRADFTFISSEMLYGMMSVAPSLLSSDESAAPPSPGRR